MPASIPSLVGTCEAPRRRDPFLVVIPCGSRKGTQPDLAMHLYTGSYFDACLKYARSVTSTPASILILSAKHGLIALHDWIEPYDLEMRGPGAVTATVVSNQAKERGIATVPTLILGGKHYVRRAAAAFPNSICLIDCMTATGIGSQALWLRDHRGHLPEEFVGHLELSRRA